ncbi:MULTISPECIES: PAS domain S-box protein [unclassified Polaromonas]|uniref:PAS domain S-box protein n=1 Tax=unclassified Polaromonas TaxID=2638319 RepID=UPI000F0747FB|nr:MULTISPECIES: PAS domain S-box protein [unclassified Polaromonas]AYQ27573.1 PAS domain S-box protein [Polaromonas sp. SP1]QGJ17587.1 PAS domain S-box protein [Polaromonas sp. Pch-P]
MSSSTAFLLKIKIAVIAGLVLMAVVGAASYLTISRLMETTQSRVRTEDTLVVVERVVSGIKNAEASLRQYLLSGNPADEAGFEKALADLASATAKARDANLMPELAELDELIARRTAVARQSIIARRDAGQAAAAAILGAPDSRRSRQRTDELLEAARTREARIWKDAQAGAERIGQLAQWLIIAGGLLFFAMLCWVVYVVKHYEEVRRRGEARLRDSEAMSRSVTEGMVEAVITTSSDDIVLEVNGAALELFGYERDELVGRDVSELVPQRFRRQYKDFTNMMRERPGAFRISGREVLALRKDGTEFCVSVSFSDVQVAGRRLFTAMMFDITESKRVTKALRASESQLRQVTDTVPALIAYLDTDECFRFHNRAYEAAFGLRFEQIDGRPLADVLGPQVYETVRDKVREVLAGHTVRYERTQVTSQGERKHYAMQYFPRYGEGAAQDQVIGFFSLGTDITELRRIDRMKTEFVSTVSHELRTPLTSIRGSLGLISGGVAGELPEAMKSLVGIAKSNCERLIRLINDILDSEKIESGKLRLDLQVVDIRQLVQQALAANEGFAGQHGVRLTMQAPETPLHVRIDSDRMTQVLTNLLSNAVKFSPAGSPVEVRLSRVAQKVRAEVVDAGPGIPEEFSARIFQKFSQADSSDTRQKGGTGLGLNISRALVEKMGGTIGFSSKPGVGTTFFFEVPEWTNPVPLLQPLRPQAASSRPRILICEGDADVARLISMMLGKAGFDSDMTYSAEQALACLAGNTYDAVTVDLKLPGQNGAAFIGQLRDDERTRHLPVVVISAMAEQGELQFNRKPYTVTDWLKKPIDENLLINSLRRAVAAMNAGKPRILHVEDDLDIQRITAAIAQDFASFEFAATLDEARARLREHPFDLVLLDLALGSHSGWDLFEDIDNLDPRPPVIVFSAGDVDPADGRQADAVLVKAHTSNTELLNTIQRVLQTPGNPGPTRHPEPS